MKRTQLHVRKHQRARGTSSSDLRTPSGRMMPFRLAVALLGITWALAACGDSSDPVGDCVAQAAQMANDGTPGIAPKCKGLTPTQLIDAHDLAMRGILNGAIEVDR